MEKRYLGSFSVPFETIYNMGRIEGVFRIDTPPVNFGYDHAASSTSTQSRNNGGMFEGSPEPDTTAGGAAGNNAVVPEETVWTYMAKLMECLSQTQGKMAKHPHDSLYYNGSHIHRDTQVSNFIFMKKHFAH